MTLPAPDPCFAKATAAIAGGNRLIARQIIESAIATSDNSVENWLLYAWTSDSPAGAQMAIDRALELEPDNELALAGQRWISGINAMSTQVVTEAHATEQVDLSNWFEEASNEKLVSTEAEADCESAECEGSDCQGPCGNRELDQQTSDELQAAQTAEPEADAEETPESQVGAAENDADDFAAEAELVEVVDTVEQAEVETYCDASDDCESSSDDTSDATAEAIEEEADAQADSLAQMAELEVATAFDDTLNEEPVEEKAINFADAEPEFVATLAVHELAREEPIEAELLDSKIVSDTEEVVTATAANDEAIAEAVQVEDHWESSSEPKDEALETAAAETQEAVQEDNSFGVPVDSATTEAVQSAIAAVSQLNPTCSETTQFAEITPDAMNALQQSIAALPSTSNEPQAEIEELVESETAVEVEELAEVEVEAEVEAAVEPAAEVQLQAEVKDQTEIEEVAETPAAELVDDTPIVEQQIAADLRELNHSASQSMEHTLAPVAAPEPTETPEPVADRPIVMIVDDSPTIRKLVTMTLSRTGFEVVAANDGVDALTLFAERRPDIILTDINLPRLGGYQLCKFVKKHENTRDIPVLLLSGKDGVLDKMRGKMAGANGYITKPFEAADLVQKIRQHLQSVKAN